MSSVQPQPPSASSSSSGMILPEKTLSVSWRDTDCEITIHTSDGAVMAVDRTLLMSSSKFWADMLSTCDTPGSVNVDETKDVLEDVFQVLNNQPQACTFNVTDRTCWDVYKKVLVVADKYDMPVVRERVEKWLVFRCLRGKIQCNNFKFQDLKMGQEWLGLCCKYGLHCLGWYVAYDLGDQLAEHGWAGQQVAEVLAGISDPDMLKTMLEAVSKRVCSTAPQ